MNLVNLISQLTGYDFKEVREGSGEFYGACPFCSQGEDRFRIFLAHQTRRPAYWCRVCRESGGEIKFVQRYLKLEFKDAMQKLEDMGYDNIYIAPPKTREDIEPPHLQDNLYMAALVAGYSNGRHLAEEYLSQWKLSRECVAKHLFGWSYTKNALTIPHTWIQGSEYITGIKYRYMTDDKGKRFSAEKGSCLDGIWNPKWVSNPDGTRQGPFLDYLFMLEAEKDAALMEDLGYPAVSYLPEKSWDAHLNRVLNNVCLPVIIYDVDTENQGLIRAEYLKKLINKDVKLVSTASLNIKSPSDLAKRDGRESVIDWVNKLNLGLEPIGEL